MEVYPYNDASNPCKFQKNRIKKGQLYPINEKKKKKKKKKINGRTHGNHALTKALLALAVELTLHQGPM